MEARGGPIFDIAQAIAVMLEKHGIACALTDGVERLKEEF